MAVEFVDILLGDVCVQIDGEINRDLFMAIMGLFIDNGLSYKVKKDGPDSYRVYCFIKKSKESLIMNTKGYDTGIFVIQLRLKNPAAFERLDEYSEGVRNLILNGKKCRMPNCCNCKSEYVFHYKDTEYRKCHMLCDNFAIHNLIANDSDSIIGIIRDEIDFGKPKRRAC